MRTRCSVLGALLILSLLFSAAQVGWAEARSLSLQEALELAFEQSADHHLFLREQDLLQKKKELQSHPQIGLELQPAAASSQGLQGPQGSLTIALPVGSSVNLRGQVAVGVDGQGVDLHSQGSLLLDYSFFAPPVTASGEPSPEEKLQREANRLVLQVVDLLIRLREAWDELAYEEAQLSYLEDQLEAAHQTPNYDDLELKRALRAQTARLASQREELAQLQLELGVLLGLNGGISLAPELRAASIDWEFSQDELWAELVSSSGTLRSAQAALAQAQAELELERKTRGWEVKAQGGVHTEPELSWNVGLTASKTLYPRQIILEELELKVAQAEQALQQQETALRRELQSSLQRVKAAQNEVLLRGEHLAAAEEDLGLRKRQYQAGLVTALQVEEARLALIRAELDYSHSQLQAARSILGLWDLCGEELTELVSAVLN